MEERYNLAIDRMKAIIEEKSVAEPYREYFQHVARFILKLDELKRNVESGKQKEMSEEELQEEMKDLYADELEANYEKSYANPAYAVLVLGGELGSFLSAVYTEIRGGISYVQEQRMEYVVIGAELLIEIYNKFEEEKQPQPESLKEIFYWYASDYCDVFLTEFGTQRYVLFGILTGELQAGGVLPYHLPKDMDTIERHAEDTPDDYVPYTDTEGNTYARGYAKK